MEWGPWIEHHKRRACPVTKGTYVQVIVLIRNEIIREEGPVSNVDNWSSVVRYRVRKPKGLQILEGILSEIDTPIKEPTS